MGDLILSLTLVFLIVSRGVTDHKTHIMDHIVFEPWIRLFLGSAKKKKERDGDMYYLLSIYYCM